jgi:hypothetical protein
MTQLHTFADGEFTITVRTEEQPNGEYTAVSVDDGPYVVGWGFSTIGAIADLFSRLPRAESDREEYDRNAAARDRAQDHRKHDIRF